MNHLNSVIFEGVVEGEPQKADSSIGFVVVSSRYFKSGEERKKEETAVFVEAYSALAERCFPLLEHGTGVRVVGRLSGESPDVGLLIVADHVEIKA